jgi:hypothetical protein
MKYLLLLLLLTGCCHKIHLHEPINDTTGTAYMQSSRVALPVDGLNTRQQMRLSKQLIKHEYRYLRDSVKIVTKTVYDTVRLREQTIRQVQEVVTKGEVKQNKDDEAWKKWLIFSVVGGFVLLAIVVLVLRKI